MTFALVSVNLCRSRQSYTLLATDTDRGRLARLACSMNAAPQDAHTLYRTLDYATAVERIRGGW